MNSARKYTVGIAGTTQHTVLCASELFSHPEFTPVWVLTPPPQPTGRKKIITPNPLHAWADSQHVPVHAVGKKILPELQQQLPVKPDFLLVVDFGYLVPQWLLDFPTVAPINIHPSLLPRWRGSSPGQFCLLAGEKTSAVTIMIMGAELDTGPVLRQDEFDIDPTWTQTEYYQFGFQLAAKHLADTLEGLANGEVTPKPQPELSPTPLAKRLKKDDGFVDWRTLEHLLSTSSSTAPQGDLRFSSSELLEHIRKATNQTWAEVIVHACHGLSPWPGVWTFLPTQSGLKRVKILEAEVKNNTKIELIKVQLEGELPKSWENVQPLVTYSQGDSE